MALPEFFYYFMNYRVQPFEHRLKMPSNITFKLVEKGPGWRYVCTDCALADDRHEWDRYSTGIFPRSDEEKLSHGEHHPSMKIQAQMHDHAEDHARFAEWMAANQ
jgi:hypothetical protein